MNSNMSRNYLSNEFKIKIVQLYFVLPTKLFLELTQRFIQIIKFFFQHNVLL